MLDHPEHKIVSGMYRLKEYPHHYLVFDRYDYDKDEDIWINMPKFNFPDEKLFKSDMVGMGCVRVDVDVLKAITPPHFDYQRPSLKEGPVMPEGEIHPGIEFLHKYYVYTNTEEAYFWRRVVDLGFEIWVDPLIRCKHMKESAIE